MRRADRDRWGLVALILLGGLFATAVLAGLADASHSGDSTSALIFYGGLLVVTTAVFIGVYRMTATRRWWLVPVLCSPATVVLGFILVVNLAMRFGPVGASQVSGIGYYPPPSTPEEMNFESDWQYAASYAAGSRQGGSSYQLQDKRVWVYIEDKQGTRYCNDEFELRCCEIVGTANWPSADHVEITLSQEGIERTGDEAKYNDPYSVALARTGPRDMLRLTYDYDAKAKKFVRTDLRILDPQVLGAVK